MRGVLTLAIVPSIFGSPGGLPSPIFGSVSGDLTTPSKWGYDNYVALHIGVIISCWWWCYFVLVLLFHALVMLLYTLVLLFHVGIIIFHIGIIVLWWWWCFMLMVLLRALVLFLHINVATLCWCYCFVTLKYLLA